ncbi:MAG: hypothetical protein IJ316_04440 [Clostridia bacterium]|nr:hypothetical protein [Clostridia bacterium]
MDERKLIDNIYANYEAFYAMTLTATMVSTYNSDASDRDAAEMINYIGNAFDFSEAFMHSCRTHILGTMMSVGLICDYHALSSIDMLSDEDKKNIDLYEIKGRALEEVNRIENSVFVYSETRTGQQVRNNMKYEAFHHPYNANLRFRNLTKQAESGELICTRQLGLMYALGIGCGKNFEYAEKLFERCILWGDEISIKLLAYLCRLNEDETQEAMYNEVFDARTKDLVTSWFDHREVCISSEGAKQCYELISLVKKMIIAPKKLSLIDIAFTDVIAAKHISFESKKKYILRYGEGLWKQEYWDNEKMVNAIGFGRNENYV